MLIRKVLTNIDGEIILTYLYQNYNKNWLKNFGLMSNENNLN